MLYDYDYDYDKYIKEMEGAEMAQGKVKCERCGQPMIAGIKGYPQKDQLHQHMLVNHYTQAAINITSKLTGDTHTFRGIK